MSGDKRFLLKSLVPIAGGSRAWQTRFYNDSGQGTAEGHALFPNLSGREAGESTSRPTKMKVMEKVEALLRSVKPAVLMGLCFGSWILIHVDSLAQ